MLFLAGMRACGDLSSGPSGPGRLGCALQPIACGVSGGPCVYLSLYFAYWLVSSLVINSLDINKACVDCNVTTIVAVKG